jgi:hypothetical protein
MYLKKKENAKIQTIDSDFIKYLTINKPEFIELDESLALNSVILSFIKRQTEILWTVEEITPNELDINEFSKLPTKYQVLIKSIILYFLFADKIVNSNLENLKDEIPYKSAKYFYNLQMYVEDIHDRIYEISGRIYYKNDKKFINDKNFMQQIINTAELYPTEYFDLDNYESNYYYSLSEDEKKIFKAVTVKINLLNKWRNIDSFLHNLIAFFTIESVSFNCLFVIINLFKKNNKGLKYLIDINEFVSRDENIHSIFGIEFYKNFIVNKLSKDEIIYIITSITDTEIDFIKTIMDENFDLDGHNRERFIDYLKNTANIILNLLGIDNIYIISEPIPIEFNLQTSSIKTNFFERSSIYISNNKVINTDDVLNLF